MKKILLFIYSLLILGDADAQRLVEVSLQETFTQEELSQQFFGFEVKNGITAYKILYETLDTDGSVDTASGLLVIPLKEVQDQQFPFLAYQHGTVSDREEVPSNMENGERRLVYYFAGQGYHTTAADYLGLGESKRVIHPYVHAATEASAGIDLILAAQRFLEKENIPFNDQLFITGYSQGGHAGMAMHKAINENQIEGLNVTAGSHMSGIYNMEGELLNISLSDGVYQFPSYLVWIIVGYQSVYGNLYDNLAEVFQEAYTTEIRGFVQGVLSRGELNDLLVTELERNHGESIPKFMLTPSFLTAFEEDPNSPMRVALRDNNLFNWIPESPMRMMYCMADDQVAFTNSTFTDSVMNANGAMDVQAIDVNSTADHGGCVIPAIFNTLTFFEDLAERSLILSTKNIDNNLKFSIYPNPASDFFSLNFQQQENKFQQFELRLINFSGQTVKAYQTNNLENFTFPLNDIPSGLYLMEVQSENGFWTDKVIVH